MDVVEEIFNKIKFMQLSDNDREKYVHKISLMIDKQYYDKTSEGLMVKRVDHRLHIIDWLMDNNIDFKIERKTTSLLYGDIYYFTEEINALKFAFMFGGTSF